MRPRHVLPVLLAVCAGLCLALPAAAAPLFGQPLPARLVPAFPALKFAEPLDIQLVPDGSERFFVVEKDGRIRVFRNDPGVQDSRLFLDLSERVYARGEGGLLGLAFHPRFADNRQFFVYYTVAAPRRVRIARFEARAGAPDQADPATEKVILEVAYPDQYSNHNAGSLAFGPVDGLLYIGMGDGGGAGDPLGSGQNRRVLPGKILRLDVDRDSGGRAYAIPADNPYAGNRDGFREEIYAWGLRNPWRIHLDEYAPGRQQLWVADVGQDEIEEINIVEAGGNYGWNTMEGSRCYSPRATCVKSGLKMPVAEYGRDQGRSVTGGRVYRGRRLPQLAGQYLFGDFISGWVWALDPGTRRMREVARLAGRIPTLGSMGLVSFGADAAGEIYLADLVAGRILRLEPAAEK